jgi:hypothetical protein
MFIVRYPSNVSSGGIVYADPVDDVSGSDGVVCTINLSKSGQYVLYLKYKGNFENGNLSLTFETSPSNLSEFYPILNPSNNTQYAILLPVINSEDTQSFRRLFNDNSDILYIPPTEDVLRITLTHSAFDPTREGSVVLNVLNAIRPSEMPYLVKGTLTNNMQKLKVVVTGEGVTNGAWKLYKDNDWLESGQFRVNTSVGTQLISLSYEVDGIEEETVKYISVTPTPSFENLVEIDVVE